MPLVVEALREQDLRLPVLIGGAAVNPEFAERIGQKDGQVYAGGVVYYCPDAFAALKALEQSKNGQPPTGSNDKPADRGNRDKISSQPARKTTAAVRRKAQSAAEVPQAPFQGARRIGLPCRWILFSSG